jgi:hypothetical protein
MTTKLEGPLRREIAIDGRPYVVTISPTGLLLTEKGRRKGFAMDWAAFVSGDVALAQALNASLANAPPKRTSPAAPTDRRAAADGDGRPLRGRRATTS